MLELLVLSTLGTEPAQPVLAKPEEAGGSPPSAFVVKPFQLQLLVFLLRGSHLIQDQTAACMSHKCGFGFTGRWSSKPFATSGCPWDALGSWLHFDNSPFLKTTFLPGVADKTQSNLVF